MPTYLCNVGGHIHRRNVAQPRLGAEWVASSLLGSRIKIHRLNLLEPGNLAVRACTPLEEPFITPAFLGGEPAAGAARGRNPGRAGAPRVIAPLK